MLLLTPWRKNYYGKESWNVKGKYIENELSSFFYLKNELKENNNKKVKCYLCPGTIPTSTGSESL